MPTATPATSSAVTASAASSSSLSAVAASVYTSLFCSETLPCSNSLVNRQGITITEALPV